AERRQSGGVLGETNGFLSVRGIPRLEGRQNPREIDERWNDIGIDTESASVENDGLRDLSYRGRRRSRGCQRDGVVALEAQRNLKRHERFSRAALGGEHAAAIEIR